MPKTKSTKAKTSASAAKSGASRYKAVMSRRFGRDVMLGALFAELVGTFVLTSAVLNTSGNIIIAALTVLIMTMALSKLSGGHINPAVTLAQLAIRKISVLKAVGYIVAQVLGAMLALVIVSQFVHTMPVDPSTHMAPVDPQTGMQYKPFSVATLNGDWRPMLAELLGGLVFGVGVAATALGKKEGIEAGFTVGGSLLLGLLLASQGSSAIVNPAVAIGVNAYDLSNWWTVAAYALGPIIGVALGAWLYKLLQWDVDNSATA